MAVKVEKVLDDGSVLATATVDDLSKLHSRIWHDELPKHLIDRATKLYPGIRDLFPNYTVDDWVNGFKYDMHPEKEIAIWEKLVSKFRAKTKGKSFVWQWHK